MMNLVSCEWLQSKVSGDRPDNLVVLDSSWCFDDTDYYASYKDHHIPSALYLEICKDVRPCHYFPVGIPSNDDFQKQARELGINADSHVVVYEKSDFKYPITSVRAWWLFKYYGHDKVSVLNGGLWEWQKAGYPVEKGLQTAQKSGDFTAEERPNLIETYDSMKNIVQGQVTKAVVDVRDVEFYKGEVDEPNMYIDGALKYHGYDPNKFPVHKGHMPASISISHQEFLDSETELTKYRPQDVWQKVFESHGVDLSKPVVFTCHLGLTASTAALIADQLGCKKWSIYIMDHGHWAGLDINNNLHYSIGGVDKIVHTLFDQCGTHD